MKIKIEKRKLLVNAPFFAAMIIFTSFFIWQIIVNTDLRKELNLKTKEFEKAEAASRHLRGLEKQMDDLKRKEEAVYKKVPLDEKEPFALMKAIIRLGGESGLRGITINIKEKPLAQAAGPEEGQEQAGAAAAESEEGVAQPQEPQSAEQGVQQNVSQEKTSPVYLEMSFEGSFPQVIAFLNKLEHLERIIKVEGILIERKKEILPYQKISLDLVTYTFLK